MCDSVVVCVDSQDTQHVFLTPKRKVRGREKIKGAAKEQIHENVDFLY